MVVMRFRDVDSFDKKRGKLPHDVLIFVSADDAEAKAAFLKRAIYLMPLMKQ